MSAELLAEHLARKLAELEGVLAERGQEIHAAAAERAASIREPVLADFLRTESAPDYVRERIASIREWMKYGEMERAYREHETLVLRLDKISQIVRTPFIVTGEKQRRYLAEKRNSGNEAKSLAASTRYEEWQRAANEVWARRPQLSNVAVAEAICAKFPTATVGTIRRKIRRP